MVKELKKDNLITGTFPLIEAGIKLAEGTYERGMAIGKVGNTFKQIGETSYTVDTLDGILAETITVQKDEEVKTVIYQTGQFNKNEVKLKGESIAIESVIAQGRKIGLFIG